ncbi:MAG TPA: TolC family protein [Candidatus Angelobacter sp.]
MKPHARVVAVAFCFLALAASLPAQDQGKPLPFRTAIELALRNSATSSLSRADLERARATVTEAHDQFVPSMTVGSALGYSNGFPLSLEGSAPSLFNVNIQGLLLNAAQHDYVKAARSDAQATAAQNADRRNDVIMETALDYMQLDLLDSSLAVQKEQQEAAAKFEDVANQRVQAGLDSPVELKRAKLAVARTRLDIARTRTAADALRLRLSQLTGLPASAIQTSTETIPQLPSVSQDDDLAGQAASNNPLVEVAEKFAVAKEFRAKAERKQLYPTVDLAGQYAVLAKYNNYAEFFKTFERNNLSIGVVIRFPFFNPTLHAAANVARFDAVKARQEVRTVKEQVSADTLKLQRSVQQLFAARDVAQLEHELAESDIDTAHAKIESGAASLKDEQNARVAEHERYTAYLSSSFDLDKAQVQLLRQTGALENWALGPTR